MCTYTDHIPYTRHYKYKKNHPKGRGTKKRNGKGTLFLHFMTPRCHFLSCFWSPNVSPRHVLRGPITTLGSCTHLHGLGHGFKIASRFSVMVQTQNKCQVLVLIMLVHFNHLRSVYLQTPPFYPSGFFLSWSVMCTKVCIQAARRRPESPKSEPKDNFPEKLSATLPKKTMTGIKMNRPNIQTTGSESRRFQNPDVWEKNNLTFFKLPNNHSRQLNQREQQPFVQSQMLQATRTPS